MKLQVYSLLPTLPLSLQAVGGVKSRVSQLEFCSAPTLESNCWSPATPHQPITVSCNMPTVELTTGVQPLLINPSLFLFAGMPAPSTLAYLSSSSSRSTAGLPEFLLIRVHADVGHVFEQSSPCCTPLALITHVGLHRMGNKVAGHT